MTENRSGGTLRAVLAEALREHGAVKEIFAEDTGADDVDVYVNGEETTVILRYDYDEDGRL